jgi:hypothetical protein
VNGDRSGDLCISEECLAYAPSRSELEPVDVRPALSDRAESAFVDSSSQEIETHAQQPKIEPGAAAPKLNRIFHNDTAVLLSP